MNRAFPIAAMLLVALAGCGQRRDLRPRDGASMPPKPAFATTVPTSTQLLTPPTELRPERSEELLLKSQERPDDRFDLPPPG